MAQKKSPAPLAAADRASENVSFATERLADIPVRGRLQPNLPGLPRQRDGNAEARIQAPIVEYIRAVAPDVLVFHIANGGLRPPAEAARMRWQGVLAGVPDLCLVAPGGRAYFLEVKTPDGRLSQDQRAIHEWLAVLGTSPAVVRGIDDARRALAAWGIPTKESAR